MKNNIYHIVRIIAYLLTFFTLLVMYYAVEDGLNNGILNNDGYLPALITVIIFLICFISTIVYCNKKIKEIKEDSI